MRTKRLISLLIAFLFVLTACAGRGEPKSQDQPAPAPPVLQGATVETKDDTVVLTATVESTTFSPGQMVAIQVKVKNTGEQPVWFIRYNGCDDGLHVELEGGRAAFMQDGLQDRVCDEAIRIAQLDPGSEITGRYLWDQQLDGAPASPGDYPVVVRFNRSKGPNFTDEDPLRAVTARVTVTLQGGKNMISRDQALQAARTDKQWQGWWHDHTGASIVKQENGQWYVLIAREQGDPTGEWVKAAQAFADQVFKEEPEVVAEFKDGVWEIRASTKYGRAARHLIVQVNGATGRVGLVRTEP